MNTTQTFIMQDNTANPAPLGLLGFGLTTILLNLANAGLVPLTSVVMGMGLFVGGLAQLFAGIMEWKKNNTFGTTAFTAYGAFWITLVAIWIMPKLNLANPADEISMGYFLTCWGIFSLGMFFGTLKLNKALQFVFGSLVILFALLAVADFSGNHSIKIFAGFEGIICGLSALYTAIAQIINEIYRKEIMPIGVVKR
jgi:succinate-acetate transporter protein